MRWILGLSMLFCLGLVSLAGAAELKSGLQPGDQLGPFTVEKVGGAVNDQVSEGEHLCYRCMLGNRPVVMVFARKTDSSVAALVKELEKKVAANTEKKLASFVNLLGHDADALKKQGKEFAKDNKLENVAIVVPESNDNGPADYNISPEAEVTVLIYRNGKVVANHALAADKLNKSQVASIIGDTDKILE